MGQRYDVIVTAKNISSGNFWLRAIPQLSCSESDAVDDVKGIIRYDNTSSAVPTTSAVSYTDSCDDEPAPKLVPYLSIDAGSTQDYSNDTKVGLQVISDALLWTVNGTSFRTAWENPTLLQLANGATTFTTKQQVIELPEADKWVYVVVHSPFAQAHPMHLHGHDFWVMDSGYGNYDANQTDALSMVDKPRRDTAMLPAAGYLVIAFPTNNPGVS